MYPDSPSFPMYAQGSWNLGTLSPTLPPTFSLSLYRYLLSLTVSPSFSSTLFPGEKPENSGTKARSLLLRRESKAAGLHQIQLSDFKSKPTKGICPDMSTYGFKFVLGYVRLLLHRCIGICTYIGAYLATGAYCGDRHLLT